MEIFRSDLDVALDKVNVACRQAADVHGTAAHALEDRALATDLQKLAEARRRAAEDIADVLRARSDGPNRPPEELELFKKAAAWAKSVVSEHGIAVLENCRAEEERVAEAAAEALREDVEPTLGRRLESLRDDARRRIDDFTRRLIVG